MPLVAGVDSSTQSTKVELRDLDTGVLIAHGRAPHPATAPPVSEQDPRVWETALHAALAAALDPPRSDAAPRPTRSGGASKPPSPKPARLSNADIAGIAVAAQQHGMVVLDAAGTPLRPAKLWNDTESAPDALALRLALAGGDAAWARACGSVPVAALTITKLSWMRRCEPERFARVAKILLPHDWLTWRLVHRFATDRGDASGTGYWSPFAGTWRPDLLWLVDPERDWEAALPEVLAPTEAAGDWDGILVGPGTGDNMAAALGIALDVGATAISLGTSGTAFTVAEAPTADPSGYVAGFADASGRYLPLACTLNATKVTDTIGRLIGASHEELDALALAAAPGAGDLTLVPYFDGERTPDRPNARGGLVGLTPQTERADVARAAFEGVACTLLDAADHLPTSTGGERRAAAPGPERIFLVGGGSRSRAYRQILADLAGVEVVVPTADEAVALGACVQAAAVATGHGIREVIETWGLGTGTVVEPSPTVSVELREAIRARFSAVAADLVWETGSDS